MSEHITTHLSNVDRVMAGVIRAAGPYTVVADLDGPPFQALARAIAHQQLNGTAANTILKRFVDSCGNGAFPTPKIVLATPEATLRAAGFSFAKIASLKDLAAKTIAGVVPDRQALVDLEDAEIITRLTQVRGIGRWTVEMMLMFQLCRPDVLPVDDFGVRNGFRLAYGLRKMPAPRALAAFGERWGPYRSAAAWYLWRAVELARDGKLPDPVERVRLPRIHRLRRAVRAVKAQLKKAKQKRSSLKSARLVKARPVTAGTRKVNREKRAPAAMRKARLKKAGSTRARR
jgi:DNA-3-methyladenine glycosylase II